MTAKDLKNALLQEAVQGKLVPQIASEGNARDLLEEIRKERGERLPLASARKRASATPSAGSNAARNARFAPITEDEIPFEIPENWCWCRLGDVIDVRDGTHDTPAYIQNGYPLITSKDFRGDHFDLSKTKYISKQDYDLINQRSKVEVGDILFSMIGGNIGNKIIITTENYFEMAIKNVALFKNNNNVYNVYLFYVLEYYTKDFQNYAVGGAQTFVSLNFIRNYPFPLPPLAEQKRIVVAIEKFMPLIEEYGKKETELKAFNEQIGALTKKAILQEAVQGKLVPQIAAEGNAKDLLEEIKKGKAKLIKDGRLKKEKPLPEITEEEISFDIPENWCWCRLGDVSEIARGGSPRPIKDYLTTDENGYNWIKIGDSDKNGKYINQTAEKIVKEGLNKTRLVHKGDFLLTNSMSFGRPYILNIDGCIHDGWLVISPKENIFNKDFLYYVLSSSFAYNQFCESVSGAVVKNLNSDKVRESLIPLPPLAEQKRIVAAIEKMLPLCEKLGE